MHGAPPTPDPHRILGFHPDMGRSGEMVPSAAPLRRKASPLPASQGGQGFPRTPICSTRTHRRWIRQDPNRTGDWEGMHGRERGNTSRSGTPTARRPHGRTHRHAARHQMRRTRSMMASLSAAPHSPDEGEEETAPPPSPGPPPRLARAWPDAAAAGCRPSSRAEDLRRATRVPRHRRPPSGLCPSASSGGGGRSEGGKGSGGGGG